MFKKYLKLLVFTAFIFVVTPVALATSGACSGHSGVSCSAGSDSDGSVICNDGWLDSSVQYSSMSMCMLTSIPTSTPSPAPTLMAVPEVSTSLSTNSQIFSDIDLSNYKSAIEFVKSEGIVDGYADNSYRPNNKINRAEFTKILVQAAFANDLLNYVPTNCFKDISTNDWFAKYICLAKDKGVIGGYSDDTFRPEQNINVAESLKITLRAFFQNIPDASGDWYQKYLNYAYKQGFMLSEWNDVTEQITRGEMAGFIYNIKN